MTPNERPESEPPSSDPSAAVQRAQPSSEGERETIHAAVELGAALYFAVPGQVVELRALKAQGVPGSGVVSGYFDNKEAFIDAALSLDGHAHGVYATLNPVLPAHLSRAPNRLEPAPAQTTGDAEILQRTRLLIDVDPNRPSGVSSTDPELEAALVLRDEIVAYLSSVGFPAPALAMSGNGAHAVYAIDLPTDDDGLVAKVLRSLAFRFDTDTQRVDQKVFNAARICKLYGTVACKGQASADRPHRRSYVSLPEGGLQVVPADLLRVVAAQKQVFVDMTTAPKRGPTGQALDVEALLRKAGVEVSRSGPWNGGRRWVLATCPFNPEHDDRSAFVVQLASGAVDAGCHHNGCAGKGWREMRAVLDPSWAVRQQAFGSSVSSGVEANEKNWNAPQPLPDGLPPVREFGFALLPDTLQAYVQDIAERIQCPPDFPAVATMVVLAGAVGRKVGIRPKRYDDWLVVPNLWGAVIGRPGVMKTPAIAEPLNLLKRLEIEAHKEHQGAQKAHAAEELVNKARRKEAERAVKNALEAGEDPMPLAQQAVSGESTPPVRRRYIVNDSTVEKLGELLNENPNGLTCFRDELVGFLKSLEREGQESARSFYLEAWNGTGSFTYDRISRGTVVIEAATVSLIGAIQPGPLHAYLAQAVVGMAQDDGFIQRIQLFVWPDISATWRNVDRWPDSNARRAAFRLVERLDKLAPGDIGCERDPLDKDGIPFLRFTSDAQERFDAWREELEPRVRSGEECPAIESHLAKYRSLVPSLALLIHLAEGGVGSVGLAALQKALGWATYLEAHARRLYAVASNPELFAARALADKILDGKVSDGFALRDVYRHGWSQLSNKDAARQAVAYLIDLDWLSEEREQTGGAPKTRYFINPRLSELKRETVVEADVAQTPDSAQAEAAPAADNAQDSAPEAEPTGWEEF